MKLKNASSIKKGKLFKIFNKIAGKKKPTTNN